MLGKQNCHFATSAYISFPWWYMVLQTWVINPYIPHCLIQYFIHGSYRKQSGNSIVEEKNINAFVYVGKCILYKYMCDLYFSLNFSFTWFLMALVGRSDWPWHSSSRTSGRFLSSLHPNCHQWGAFCVWRWLLWQQGSVYFIFYFTSVPFVSNT